MTNLQKASNLISDILDLKLGIGDVVELQEKLNMTSTTYYCVGAKLTIGKEIGLLDVPQSSKLIQRNITLPMVLEAIKLKVVSFYILEDGRLYMVKTVHNDTISGFWQLRKSGKDLNLFDQKNEKLYKFIIKVLK